MFPPPQPDWPASQRAVRTKRSSPVPTRSPRRSAPCIISTSCLEMARPRPVPPYLRVVEPSACVNDWKISGKVFVGHADAGVGHRDMRDRTVVALAPPWRATSMTTSPRSVNLTALVTRFDEHLPHPPRVAAQQRSARRRRWCKPAPPLCLARAAPASQRCPPRLRANQNRCVSKVSLPASIFEKSRMSLMMLSSVSVLLRMVSTNSRCSSSSVRVQQQVRHARDGIHRRADLVAHVGEELGLDARRLQRGVARVLQRGLRLLQFRHVARDADDARHTSRTGCRAELW